MDEQPPAITPHGQTCTHSLGASIFDNEEGSAKVIMATLDEFPMIWMDNGFVNIPKDHWMQIILKSDWESKIKGKAQVYPLGLRD